MFSRERCRGATQAAEVSLVWFKKKSHRAAPRDLEKLGFVDEPCRPLESAMIAAAGRFEICLTTSAILPSDSLLLTGGRLCHQLQADLTSTFLNIEPGPALDPMSGFVRFWCALDVKF